ncbi:MAG: TIM barrel protein [Puniceicoccales bacterium]|jgi:hydroxypyruvate isomerase|nr:TIM barrel protein [Puniceicoccales bacterium]
MNRRQILNAATVAGTFTALSHFVAQTAKADDKASVKSGSFRHSVCAWCYKKISLDKLALAAKDAGLASVELLTLKEVPIVQKHGLTCAVAYGPNTALKSGFNQRRNHEKLVPGFIEAIAGAAKLGVPNLICFSGNRAKLSAEEGLEICAEGLKKIMPAAEKAGVTLIMELLNSKVDHKDYQCDSTAWGVELVKRVGSERFKLLYDIYHMQIMEGDVIRTIRQNAQYIAHYHTAGNPGRNEFEPSDIQELNYPAIMKAIHDTGFRGFVGQEFIPKRNPLRSLANAVSICTVS